MTLIGTVVNEEHKNTNYIHDNGKQWPQILAIFTVSLGFLSCGIIYSWSSPFIVVITADKENYDITEEEASYFTVFQPVGIVIASILLTKVLELLGRKKSVLLVSIPQLLCWITIIFARSKWEFYVARILGGMGDYCVLCSIPAYIGEITTPSVRGLWGNIPTFFLYGGQFIITVLGSYLGVKITAYICMVVPILLLALVSLLPESPYQLIKNGKYDEARKSIKWLRRKANIEGDFKTMKDDVERQMSESGQWKDLFKITSNMRALRAGVFLRFSQQLGGIGVFATYTQTIFAKAGGNLSPQYSSMIFMGLLWILNLICSVSVEKFGRKLSYAYSCLSSGIILLMMAVYFLLEQYQFANLEQITWFPLAGMLSYVFTYSFGLGVVPTLMLAELFSASIKSKALSILVIFFGLSILLTTNVFLQLSSNVGLYSPFLLYGICCILSTILTLLWVPETKGKTLEEIQQSLKK